MNEMRPSASCVPVALKSWLRAWLEAVGMHATSDTNIMNNRKYYSIQSLVQVFLTAPPKKNTKRGFRAMFGS